MNNNDSTNIVEELENELRLTAYLRGAEMYNLRTLHTNELKVQAIMSMPTSDLLMVDAFKKLFGYKFVYVPESATRGTFYAWDGTIWVAISKQSFGNSLSIACSYFLSTALTGHPYRQETGSLGHLLSVLEEGLGSEHASYKVAEAKLKAIRSYANNLESNSGLTNLTKQLKAHLEVPADYFDKDSDYIVFADGKVINTKEPIDRELKKSLKEPDERRAVSRKIAIASDHVDPQPKAWQVALDNWQPDKDTQKTLQVAAGAALLGQGTAKNVICIYGRSNTGKSTYARTLARVFGGYSGTMWPTAIEEAYSVNFEQDSARGARFLLVEEPGAKKTDDTFLKNLSGGGSEVKTQKKGKDPIAWRPQCVLHMTSNVKPNINTSDLAMVKRLNFVEFEHVFEYGQDTAAKEYDETLFDLAGMAILEWILEGARIYEELQRIPLSDSIIRKAQENVADNSSVIQWIDELFANQMFDNGCVRLRTENDLPVNHYASKPEAYKYYRAWCRTTDEDFPMNKKDFARDVKSRLDIKSFPKSRGDERIPGVILEHSEDNCQKTQDRCPRLAMFL